MQFSWYVLFLQVNIVSEFFIYCIRLILQLFSKQTNLILYLDIIFYSGETLDNRYNVFGYTGQGVFSNVVRYTIFKPQRRIKSDVTAFPIVVLVKWQS